jgi:hypothetical protein
MNALNAMSEYMPDPGLAGRPRPAAMARADAATRNRVPASLARLLRAQGPQLQASNAPGPGPRCGEPAFRADGGPPQAHTQGHRHRGRRLRAARRHARRDRRDRRACAAAQRHPGGADAGADRRVCDGVRKPPQRDHRGGQPVHQEWQRLHPARWLGGDRVQQGAGAAGAAGAGRQVACPPMGATGADHRPRRGRADHHARSMWTWSFRAVARA